MNTNSQSALSWPRNIVLRGTKEHWRNFLSIVDLAQEPFRFFFPTGVVAGVTGVLLWPLYFTHFSAYYPGTIHARIMVYGFLGAFIFGFLGTAMPRMLSAKPLRPIEAGPLLLLHLTMTGAYATGRLLIGDTLFLIEILLFCIFLFSRAKERSDIPPPGFVLVGLALLNVIGGIGLAMAEHFRELDLRWVYMERLLSSQGFILLPILGIGPFLLPRFFGMPNPHDFPEARTPNRAWLKKAGLAAGCGVVIVLSFFIEASGKYRTAYALRFGITSLYMLLEMPFHRAPRASSSLGFAIRIGLAGILAGFFAVFLFPAYRVALLHLSFVGGFAVITVTVATRVVFGHSGNGEKLTQPNRWLLIAIGLMLFGMATRISGDFSPKIMASHYTYGALVWICGMLLWLIYVLPKMLLRDAQIPDEKGR